MADFSTSVQDTSGTLDSILIESTFYSSLVSSSNTTLTVTLPIEGIVESVIDPNNYSVVPFYTTGVPVTVFASSPITSVIQTGANASITGPYTVGFAAPTLTGANVGDYIFLSSTSNRIEYARILAVNSPTEALVNKRLVIEDPLAVAQIPYSLRSAITGTVLTISKPTNGEYYRFRANLKLIDGSTQVFNERFQATAVRPQVVSSVPLSDGQMIVTFSEQMSQDQDFMDPRSYDIDVSDPPTGWDNQGVIKILSVRPVAADKVVLETQGLRPGGWSVSVGDPRTLTIFPRDVMGFDEALNIQLNTLPFSTVVADTCSITDSYKLDYTKGVEISDAIDLADNLKFHPLAFIFDDDLSVTDDIDTSPVRIRDISDTVSVTDTINTRGDITLKETPISVTDTINTRGDITLKETPISVTDSVIRNQDTLKTVNDSVSAADTSFTNVNKSRTYSDTMVFDTDEVGIQPKITALNFPVVDDGGGDSVTITGKALSNATLVTVGGTSATISSNTSTSIVFIMPAKSPGSYNVQVTTNGGSSNTLSIEAWSPAQISNIEAYFDSRKGVVVSGSDVTTWTEQSGSRAYTSVSSHRPTLVTGVFQSGSKPGIRFTPSVSAQWVKGTRRTYNGARGIWWVGKWYSASTYVSGANPTRTLVSDATLARNSYGVEFASSTVKLGYTEGNANLPASPSTTWGFFSGGSGLNLNQVRLVGINHDSSSGGFPTKLYSGTTEIASINTGGILATGGYDMIGAGYLDGTNGTVGFDGDVGAVVITAPTVLGSSDRTKLYQWAQASFGAL